MCKAVGINFPKEGEYNEILLPIKKIYSDLIFEGSKGFEFRKSASKVVPNIIHVYEAEGNKKIVGRLSIEGLIIDEPESVWEWCKDSAGISKEDFFKYFEGCDTAYAYVIEDTYRFAKPRSLEDYDLKFAPQGRIWVIRDWMRLRGSNQMEQEEEEYED